MGFLKTIAGLVIIFFGISGLINIIPKLATNVNVDSINPFVILGITTPTLGSVTMDVAMFGVLLVVGIFLVFHKKHQKK